MDKRKLRLILLVIVGIVILIIGIKASMIYSQPRISKEALNRASQTLYGKSWDALDDVGQFLVWTSFPYGYSTIEAQNAEFKEWLVKPLKWIGIGFCIFLILTAALVVSRVISNRIRPPSNPS